MANANGDANIDVDWKLLGKDRWRTGNDLIDFYNQCHIWYAPTKLEGFHNIPVEAALCGCLILCLNNPKNGMGDYANEETAHIYDPGDEISPVEYIDRPDYSKVKKMDAYLRLRIGSRERNMKRFVECLK